MIPGKCQLCSWLFSKLSPFFRRLTGACACQCLHLETGNDSRRVEVFDLRAPACTCESHRVSSYSPGIVERRESVARFAFAPIHRDKKGKIKPSIFSQVMTDGCSVQRESYADNNELNSFVSNFLTAKADRIWFGVLTAKCEDLRNLSLGESPRRAVCVYDTSEKHNPAHAEMFGTAIAADEGDENELRRLLMGAFDNGKLIPPSEYLGGNVWRSIRPELRGRT